MLIDKGYYDYDYEPKPQAPIDAAKTALNDDDTRKLVSRFGFGVDVPETPEKADINELQKQAMREHESETINGNQ